MAAGVASTVADYASSDCEATLSGHDRTLAVGPSNANKCGGELFPWRLKVVPGQRVNVTLIQFDAGNSHHVDDHRRDEDASTVPTGLQHVMEDQYGEADSAGDGEQSPVRPA